MIFNPLKLLVCHLSKTLLVPGRPLVEVNVWLDLSSTNDEPRYTPPRKHKKSIGKNNKNVTNIEVVVSNFDQSNVNQRR